MYNNIDIPSTQLYHYLDLDLLYERTTASIGSSPLDVGDDAAFSVHFQPPRGDFLVTLLCSELVPVYGVVILL